MAVIKQKTRKKLSKQLSKLVKRHGAEMTLALVTGIISSLAAARANKASKKTKGAAKPDRAARPVRPVRPMAVRKRATA